MKICIIGHPGSGKTYLANKLSDKTSIEKIDIDVLFDRHPLYALSKKLYARALTKLLDNKDDWIIDGYHVSLMPTNLWKEVDKIIYLNLPKDELKQNVITRYKVKKAAKDFSHWQSTRINNLKNFWQIKFQDKALKVDVAKIQSLMNENARFTELKSRSEIQQYIDHFFGAA